MPTTAEASETKDCLDAKRAQVKRQFRESMEGEAPKVTCGCGAKAPLRFMFRCFHCGEYYCRACALEHFGPKENTRSHADDKEHASSDGDVR